ncbi:hypothetical protein BDZ94DRAFT_1322516 [Collybia nuda]|uniref:Uncharacterized protein n=1 Tax=Collybia nuda TaxID=64659 RepID=A0A9P5Y5B4_9AGAR|nr:hypothetical protein BDZ94DRAFT_1322516 [Collybia nuda]
MPGPTHLGLDVYNLALQGGAREMPPRVPAPSHRHGTPSGPWPFLDLDDQIDQAQLATSGPPVPTNVCDHLDAAKCKGCWSGYPQSLFPNWTRGQQKKSRISKIVSRPFDHRDCVIHYVDIAEDGNFAATEDLSVGDANKDAHWDFMRQPGTRLRAMFVEHLTGPVLQMLGTKYNIEPFYFSSSIGWIPSRYQEAVQPNEGDPPLLRSITPSSSYTASTISQFRPTEQVIDTQAPLSIRSSDRILFSDLLALHMVRSSSTSTIISYHPGADHRTTSAETLHARLNAAGRSVYWNTIFANNDDPTFVFLVLLWYALYAWDEAFEVLYKHICWLESQVIRTNEMELTQELHVVQAHLLHYASLLEDFRKAVVFVLNTPNPALNNPSRYSAEERDRSYGLMRMECQNLLSEIERLEQSRVMQGKRLKNVMNLGFSSVNIKDSRYMRQLTEAAVRDSAAMKQVSYLTMFFLPASLVATPFGMNVEEINPGTFGTLPQYLAIAIPLTVVTVWVVIAFQFHPGSHYRRTQVPGDPLNLNSGSLIERSLVWRTMGRIGWPVMLALDLANRCKARQKKLHET